MPEPRPPKATIPASANTAAILALLRFIDARLARLEADDDRRAAVADRLRKKDQP